MTELFRDISTMKNIGVKRSAALRKLGISTPYELLCHYPRSYIDFSSPSSLMDAKFGEHIVLSGTVRRRLPENMVRRGMTIYKSVVTDEMSGGDFIVTFFNNFYAWDALITGEEYYFYGKLSGDILRAEIISPQVLPRKCDELMRPVYPLTEGLTNAMMHTSVSTALKIFDRESFDYMPSEILHENNLCDFSYALHNIHFPKSSTALEAAKRRLAFDELLILQLGMLMMKGRGRSMTGCRMEKASFDDFFATLPFSPTNVQKRAISELSDDMCRNTPMNRLLQGDVGSGKTMVAAALCFFAFKNGFQSALMAPTEILAIQHFNTLSGFLKPLGISICLLTGSQTVKEKNAIRKSLAAGEYAVAVGTHALFQKTVEFSSLGLVITDEQHRFGVAQRTALAEKGKAPHRLVMSATPIPRTLGLIIYGDLDISVLDELPAGRIPIKTYAVTGGFRERVFGFIRSRLDKGGQAYIVCPAIENNDGEMKSVIEYSNNISQESFTGYSIAVLHGKMSPKEKDETMKRFKNGEIQLLVSTTVIEVGVDVPNATIILIEDADRFGLSQLHQLRGRVGRGSLESHCILITENATDEVRERLKIISSTNDGFKISEEDLRLRGPGDFFGERQHGLPNLKIADIASDMELVHLTQNSARKIYDEDCELVMDKHKDIRSQISLLFTSASN